MLLILQVSLGKLANFIAAVYHFHDGVNSFLEKVVLHTSTGMLFFVDNAGDL